MALTLTTEILNQQATSAYTYCYLYEPLRIVASESDNNATKLYIDLEVLDTEDDTSQIEELMTYAEFDLNPGQTLSIDLMNIAREHHDAEVYKFGTVSEIIANGWSSVISKYKYNFKIYTDVSARQSIKKIPIIGARSYGQFTPVVNTSSPITEFEYHNLDVAYLENKWSNIKLVRTSLVDPTLQDAKPSLTLYEGDGTGCDLTGGGWLIWKSRFGGWMFWGFSLKQETFSGSYDGNLETGMFESDRDSGGNPFIPVNYVGIDNAHRITLRSLSLSSEELWAVSGIHSSPVVYYSEPGSDKIELMRRTSASTPLDNLANGGDFSVSLANISKTSQRTI